MATRGRKHLGTILVALVTAALTTGLMSALPGNAATTGDGPTPLGTVGTPRLLAGFHTVRSSQTAVPTIDKWFNAVNGVEPTLTGGDGEFDVDVGFRTARAFALCSVDTNYVDTRDALCTVSTPFRKFVRVRIWDTGTQDGAPHEQNAEFWVLVYGA
jgi:hypothetical protein